DANGKNANSVGSAKFLVVPGNPATPADEADVNIQLALTDVRKKSDLSDYTGELQLVQSLRITDKLNGSAPVDPATLLDIDFPVTVPCLGTVDVKTGSACSIATSADSVLPGSILETR